MAVDLGTRDPEPEVAIVLEEPQAELAQVVLVVDGVQTSVYAIHPSMLSSVRHVLEGMSEVRPIGHVDYEGKWVQG